MLCCIYVQATKQLHTLLHISVSLFVILGQCDAMMKGVATFSRQTRIDQLQPWAGIRSNRISLLPQLSLPALDCWQPARLLCCAVASAISSLFDPYRANAIDTILCTCKLHIPPTSNTIAVLHPRTLHLICLYTFHKIAKFTLKLLKRVTFVSELEKKTSPTLFLQFILSRCPVSSIHAYEAQDKPTCCGNGALVWQSWCAAGAMWRTLLFHSH